jgi:hypothetical protein
MAEEPSRRPRQLGPFLIGIAVGVMIAFVVFAIILSANAE